MFDHPVLGGIIQRALDAPSERALMSRAERYGYDLRTLDKVVIGWAADGTTVYLAQGAIDASRIANRLYSELLHPRSHSADASHNERIEGPLRQTHVALFARPICALVAYSEGPTGALVDRVMGAERSEQRDTDAVLAWSTRRRREELVPAGAALLQYVDQIEVAATIADDGLLVRGVFVGQLPADAPAVIQRVAAEFVASPLGSFCGAAQWAHADRIAISRSAQQIQVQITVPWAGVREILTALQGRL
jgi:hypothetical protein